MKIFLGLISSLFLSQTMSAQVALESEVSSLVNDTKKSYSEIVYSVDSLLTSYKGDEKERVRVRKKYERWKHLWKYRLNEKNERVDFAREFQKLEANKNNSSCNDLAIDVNWTNLNYNGNFGVQIDMGRTTCISFSPADSNVFYVGTPWGGLWRTEDGGLNYENVNDRLPLAAVSSIIIDPNNEDHMLIALSDMVWYGVSSIGIYESFDGGESVQPTSISFNLNQNRRIYDLTYDPMDPSVILAATSYGLIRTTDFFASSSIVIGNTFTQVDFSPSNPNVVYASTNSGRLFSSSNGGVSFQFIGDFGAGNLRFDIHKTNPNKLVLTCDNLFFHSTDGGVSAISSTMPDSDCVVSYLDDGTESAVVGFFNIYRTDNNGASFYQISDWLGGNGLPVVHVDQRNIETNPFFNTGVYFCNDGGIFRYDGSTSSFSNLSKGLIITQYYDIAVSETDSLVLGGGSQDNGNVTRQTQGDWKSYAQTGDGMEQAVHNSNSDIRFWEYQFGGMMRYDAQTDQSVAIKPSQVNYEGAWHTPYVLDPNNDNRIVCGFGKIFESLDLGDTWSELGSITYNGSLFEEIAIAPSNSDQIYASKGSSLWRKEPNSNWQPCATPNINAISGIQVDAQNENVVYISVPGFASTLKVFKSINGGASWENITGNLPNLPITSMRIMDSQFGSSESGLFVGTYGAVYYLPEGSSIWYKFGCLPATEVSDIEIQYSTNKIFIGTHGRGIFSASLNNFEWVGLQENESDDFTLFPNPTNGKLQIKGSNLNFESLLISDVSGKKIYEFKFSDNQEIDLGMLDQGSYFITFFYGSGLSKTKTIMKL